MSFTYRWYQQGAIEAMTSCTNNGVVVLPTGSGKSIVLRGFVENSNENVLILSHVKEILEQNFNKLAGLPDIGLYSAGLGVKHVDKVTVAGIHSVYKHPDLFRHVDKVLIDECHMVNDEGMYKRFLDNLGVPYLGLTATPFRLKQGYIHVDGMFDEISYEASVARLTREGYLSKMVTYGSEKEFDTSSIATVGGDFKVSDMSDKFNREKITSDILAQLTQYKSSRKHWLLFCIDIKHAEAVSAEMNRMGISCAAVHSDSPRDQTLLDFKAGKIQAVANVNVLTIGFDFPEIDLIAVLRPTKSPTLHMQMLGRGLRTAEGKEDCLVKDFAGNINRLGTVANLQIDDKGKMKKKGKGDPPFLKTCPKCELLVAPAVRKCRECGHEFKFKHNLKTTAYKEKELPKWFDVTRVVYRIHTKPGSPDMLKVTYMCGVRMFNEFVLLDHIGYAQHKAKSWVNNRWRQPTRNPVSVRELHKECNKLWTPSRIRVEEAGKYPKIIGVC